LLHFFVLSIGSGDFNQFEKQKRWRRLPGQDNRENNSARFSCAHVFTQPGQSWKGSGRANVFRFTPAAPLKRTLRNTLAFAFWCPTSRLMHRSNQQYYSIH
jgi:hypothetical protein